MWVLPKLAGDSIAPVQVGFLRYAAGAVCIAPLFLLGGRDKSAAEAATSGPRLMFMHAARAACGVATLVLGAYAVTRIPLANVQAIAMTNGVFTMIFAAIFLRERIGWREALAGTIALAGAFVVAGPGTAVASGWAVTGVIAAFAQAIGWGAEVVLLKATAARDRPSRMLFQVNLMAAGMVFIVGVWFWQPVSLGTFWLIVAMGPIAIIGQLCNIQAFRMASASMLVPVRYSGIVFAALFGILFFDEWPDSSAVIGALMIAGGAIWLALGGGRKE